MHQGMSRPCPSATRQPDHTGGVDANMGAAGHGTKQRVCVKSNRCSYPRRRAYPIFEKDTAAQGERETRMYMHCRSDNVTMNHR